MNKKSQAIGRNTIMMIFLLLMALLAAAYVYWQAGGQINYYIDKLFR